VSAFDLIKKSLPEQIYDKLRDLITGPGYCPGDRLESMTALAKRFQVSVPTVNRALEQLQTDGLIDKRHGAGTFVASQHAPLTLHDSVVLCLDAGGHVWGELTSILLQRLHESNRFASLLHLHHEQAGGIMARLSHSDASCFVVHGQVHFPFPALLQAGLRRKPIIGVVDWQPQQAGIPLTGCVLSDHRHGARQIVRHLMELGHRKALIVGTNVQIYFMNEPTHPAESHFSSALRLEWAQAGGSYATVSSAPGAESSKQIEEADFLQHFEQADPPSAVIGLRDTEAFLAQQILNRHRPDLAKSIAITGYCDTLWGTMGQPPITSVNMDIETIAHCTMDMLTTVLAGKRLSRSKIMVYPQLKVRASSANRRP